MDLVSMSRPDSSRALAEQFMTVSTASPGHDWDHLHSQTDFTQHNFGSTLYR